MKKLIKFAFSIFLLSITILSCRTKISNEIKEKNVTSLKKGLGMCFCSEDYVNPNCEGCVKYNFMGNQTSKEYTINWTSCQSDDPLFSSLCSLSGSNYQSRIKFCYGPKPPVGEPDPECRLYMTIDGAPLCASNCVTSFPYCVKLKATCKGNAGNDIDLTLDSDDSETGLLTHITWTITGDPIITICCNKKVNPTTTYSYCCTGQTTQ